MVDSGLLAAEIIVGPIFMNQTGFLLWSRIDLRAAWHWKQPVDVGMERVTELLQRFYGDVLILILDTHDGRLCDANFTREITLGNIPTLFSNEFCQSLPQMNHMWFIIEATNHMGFISTFESSIPRFSAGSMQYRAQ